MGLQIEIVERSSVIVVTLTGATDLGALEPLNDALRAATEEGTTVVLDITQVAQAGALTAIIEAIGPAATTLKLVSTPSTKAGLPPGGYPGIYASVEAAIAVIRAAETSSAQPSDADLAAKFADLGERYEQMIDQCRQLLYGAEKVAETAGQTCTDS